MDHFFAIAYVPLCSPPFGAIHGSNFAGGDGNVYRACASDPAADPSQYTSFDDGAVTSEGVHNPVLSPDETQILFELANPSTGFHEIWVVANTPGSIATQLIADNSNYLFHPFWHPDSDQFTYVHGTAGKLITAGGGGVKKSSVSSPGTTTLLKSSAGGKSPFRPQFSPDGAKMSYVFDQDVGGTGELRVMDQDGTNDTLLDNAVKYRFQGPQSGWAHNSTLIAYDDGTTGGVSNAYVIAPDGTGKTQLNANGDAAGNDCRVSDRCFPPANDYVIIGNVSGFFTGYAPTRCELDGSTSSWLDAFHGSAAQDYFRQVLYADNRIWFIESGQVKVSYVLIDGTGYTNILTIDGAQVDSPFGSGTGWFYN